MDESELDFQKAVSSDSKDNELEVNNKAQNEDSEVRFQNGAAIFEKFHKSVVGHLGCDRTYKSLKFSGHNWVGMKEQLKNYIAEYTISQKIKWQRLENQEDIVEHHLYSVAPLSELSIDTMGALPEDKEGMRYIILIVDNFSKFVGLYSANSTSTKEFVKALLSWVGIFDVPKTIRSDRGSQFTSNMAQALKNLLKYQHIVVVAYHPQSNSLAKRRMKEVLIHLRALVYEFRIKEDWSHYLPLVQRIIYYTIDGSIGTQPARVIFGDMIDSDIAMDLPEGTTAQNPEDNLVKLREAQSILVQTTQEYLKKNQRKRGVDGGRKEEEITKFAVRDYILLMYQNHPPKKLSRMYRGPMDITVMDRPDLVKVNDLITNRESLEHASRLRPFKHPKDMSAEKIESLVAADLDEFYVEKIIGHTGTGKNPKQWQFRVHWREYEPEEDTMLDWAAAKDLAALDDYCNLKL
jgi:hypothetical protein